MVSAGAVVSRVARVCALVAVAAVSAGAPAAATAAPACTVDWTGAGSNANWSNPANWMFVSPGPNTTPGASDVVCIPSGVGASEPVVDTTFTVSSVQAGQAVAVHAPLTVTDTVNASTFTSVDLSAGSFNSDGTATLSGTLNWTGGDLGGSGGATHVLSTGAINITSQFVTYNIQTGHSLVNDGGGGWSNGTVDMASGATWTINGAFDFSAPYQALNDSSGGAGTAPALIIGASGVLTTNLASSGTTLSVNVAVHNDGTIRDSSGTLILDGGGSGDSHGRFDGTGGDLRFAAGGGGSTILPLSLGNGASLTNVEVYGYSYNVTTHLYNGGLVSVASGAKATASGVNLDGGSFQGSGELDVTGSFDWTAGQLGGAGSTVFESGTTLTVATAAEHGNFAGLPPEIADGHNVVTHGTVTWQNGPIYMGVGSAWNNSGAVTASGQDLLQPATTTAPLPIFTNTGTFTVDPAAGATGVNVLTSIVNTGAMSATTSPLTLGGGGAYASTLSDSGTITGATLDGTSTLLSGAQLNGGTLSGFPTVPVGNTVMSTNLAVSGTLAGAGTLTLAGTATIQGSLNEDILVDSPTGATLSFASGLTLNGGSQLETDGTTTTGSHVVSLFDAASWLNTGMLTIGSANLQSAIFGGTLQGYYNVGTIEALSPSGTPQIDGVLNDGTIDVQRGQLTVRGIIETTDATIEVGIGGTSAGSGYGQLTAYGGLAGTIQVVLNSGYTPAVGTTYDVVSTGGVVTSDPFSSHTGLGYAGGSLVPSWHSDGYTATLKLTATATPAGRARRQLTGTPAEADPTAHPTPARVRARIERLQTFAARHRLGRHRRHRRHRR
jgi:hypothetical protein